MGKECFTCSNKISTELTNEHRKEMKEEAIARGEKWPTIPEMIFHCKVTNKRISQIDPACEDYSDDANLVDIRKIIAKTATKLRKELEGVDITANTVLECVICENCKKIITKVKAMKVPECYFKGNKVFYVCNEDCLKEFISAFR